MTDASHCLENLDALDALGVELALDDFGTGYSSLAYLRKLPITILKIDRAFMTGDVLEPADAAVIEAVIGLARALGLPPGRRGRRDRRPVGRAQAPRLRVRAGLLLQPPAARF